MPDTSMVTGTQIQEIENILNKNFKDLNALERDILDKIVKLYLYSADNDVTLSVERIDRIKINEKVTYADFKHKIKRS